MNVVNAGADVVGVFRLDKGVEQFHFRARAFDGNHVRVHGGNGVNNIVEFGIAHVRVNLRGVLHAGCGQFKGVDRPFEIIRPRCPAQRQAFAQRRFINLNHADAGFFQIMRLVAQRKADLLAGDGTRLIVARERPFKDRDRPGQHSFHRLACQRLGVC